MTETAAPNSPLHLMPHSANAAATDVLPDTVLLEVFDVYRVHVLWKHQWKHQHWFKLAHVCRRWRELVLSSPSRLHLCLYCTQGTHAADLINHFPTLPLILDYSDYNDHSGGDGIRYALKHVSRARKVWLQSRDVETVLATFTGMKQPAEELEDLRLELAPRNGPIVIKSFLGGHAPRLRRFHLSRLIFSPLPVLLSPMPNLVSLKLNVFSSTVIRPAELLVQLSAMLRLENLYLHFFPAAENDAPVDSDGVAPSPRTRILLAELSEFTFTGHSNWLEAFVDGMEPGAISNLTIRFYDEPLLRTPHLGQFVARSEVLRPTAFHLSMHNETIAFSAPNDDLPSRIVYSNPPDHYPSVETDSVTCICSALADTLSSVRQLHIEFTDEAEPWDWRNRSIVPAQWHALLAPFRGVQRLVLRGVPEHSAARWLNASVGQTPPSVDLLPELAAIVQLERWDARGTSGVTTDAFAPFLAGRERAGRPVSVETQQSIW